MTNHIKCQCTECIINRSMILNSNNKLQNHICNHCGNSLESHVNLKDRDNGCEIKC